ncbi:hypothetical protein ACFX1W_041225 [Malus domestica]
MKRSSPKNPSFPKLSIRASSSDSNPANPTPLATSLPPSDIKLWSSTAVSSRGFDMPLPLSERADLSAGSSGGSVSDAKPSASSSGASTAKVSTDKYRNSAVVAGVITTTASLGWSPKASRKKEEVQD